ncbi:MAG: DUF1015 domain-containing protein [Bacillota bacterium]
MAVVRPFKGIRPRQDLAENVACLPYDVMNRVEAKAMAEGNPYSFLHIGRSEIDLVDEISPYDDRVYETARQNLDKMISDGILIQDKEPVLYIYRQMMKGRVQTGIVGCTSIDDYIQDKIKKHEFTRVEKEIDRIKHFDYCGAHTEPVFLTYRYNQEIHRKISHWIKFHEPIYNFTSEDGIAHIVWTIDNQQLITEICQLFSAIDCLYIADGHHRSASAVKVGLKRREGNPEHHGDEEYNYFLSVIFPDEDLYIMDYNRVVEDLNGFSSEEFIHKVSTKFDIISYQDVGPYKPKNKHEFGMYLDGKWSILIAKEGTYTNDDPVDRLDVSILQKNLLDPILGIADPRTDKRIDFVGGIRGLEELENRVAKDMKVAFAMFPTSIEDLMDIADEGEVMPPKSTWFEPKLRSGLFVHRF